MSKKPVPSHAAIPQRGDHLRLDFAYDDSGDDLYGDSDLGDFSGSEDDFESDVTLEELAGSSLDLDNVNATQNVPHTKGKGGGASNGDSMALVSASDSTEGDAYDVDSEEEQDLLKGIKDEIRDMVREEMQSELKVYEHKIKAIEAGRFPSADGGAGKKEEDKYPDLADMEPELRDAYIKMRKLDRILDKKLKKEKEVKRDRILLERRIREEINAMQANGNFQKEIKTNTDRYLALALPPSHNQGVIVDEPPVTPVFQTQVNEHDLEERRQKGAAAGSSRSSAKNRQKSASSSRTDGTSSSVDANESRSRSLGRRRRRRKDFIKRNKELAANANEHIAMTDDEKKRLQELLSDVDGLPEIQEEGFDSPMDENPYQMVIKPGEGYVPSDTDLRSLTAIDERLQSIMPEEQFRSIASSVLSHAPQQRLFTRVGARSEVSFEEYREKALMETEEEREVTTQLKEIEERLSHFHNTQNSQSETSVLSEEQLDDLLDDCVRSMSSVSLPVYTPDSIDSYGKLESARAQLMGNPPRLSDEMLQQLLSEAHFPLSSQLMALRDDDSKSAQDGEGGPIRAETWKAIIEETLSGEEEEEDSSLITSSPRDQRQGAFPHPPQPKHSAAFPRISVSDTVINPTSSRKPPLHRYNSETSDSDGRDSRVSLPEILSTSLINTPQGGGAPNNDPVQYYSSRNGVRTSSSLDNMVRNDLSREMPPGQMSSNGQGMAGTPLTVEDLGDQGQTTPTPHPPSSDRSTSRRTLMTRKNSLEREPSS
ncbi:fibrous sheath-interacting protein 1-like [Littorina saxatilis]|uniref:fibrous sheath-interacting protein 1-like n=1 Tax=Littorina saxatilis TaxID=31220 RepID=UPI0038B621F2